MIFHPFYTGLPGAMGTTKKCTIRFDAVADDTAIAMLANRSKTVNGTFETIENMRLTCRYYLE
jgi:hypothetical protein